jgi:hypothetical protein
MTRSMFGINPERVLYKYDGCSPSFTNMTAHRLRPFRAYVSWLCHSIGLHPTLMYGTPSGLTIHSPEGALYLNDGCSQSHRERTTITSPERAVYTGEAVTPLAKWEIYISEAVTPLAIKTRAL